MNYIKKEFVFLGSRENLSKRIAQDLFNYRFAWEWCLSKQAISNRYIHTRYLTICSITSIVVVYVGYLFRTHRHGVRLWQDNSVYLLACLLAC